MRRRLALLACGLTLAVGAAGCFASAPPPDPWAGEQAKCEQGIAQARAQLGAGRMAAPVQCDRSTLPGAGGVFLGGVAHVFWGPGPGPAEVYVYRLRAGHELGHGWDFLRLNDWLRARWAQILARPWNAEAYADTFMMLTMGASSGFYGTPLPSSAQRAALCGERIVPC